MGLGHLERLRAVLDLAALVLHGHDDARGQVRESHGALRLVHALPARAARAEDVDAHVFHVQIHVCGCGAFEEGVSTAAQRRLLMAHYPRRPPRAAR